MTCLNCGKEFAKSDKYCSLCGQSTLTTRMSTKHALHQFFHAFTHTDKGFFDLIPQLLTKPGIIAREYNQGKRKTYFNPFTFFLIIVAISTLMVSTFKIMTAAEPSTGPIEARTFTDFANKHFNILVFISTPVTAYFTSLFFRGKLNFAESLVLITYTNGERSIFFILFVVPLDIYFKQYHFAIIYTYLTLFLAYYGWACCQYFNTYKIKTFLRGAASILLTQLFMVALVASIITIAIVLKRFPSH